MDKISENSIETNESFQNFIKPSVRNKGSNDITLMNGKNVITHEYEISNTFNKHYVHIVEKGCGNNLIK